ncbi:hypothetical protein NP233_g2033 [Leucocoprinus birnbaumii]|uniref:Uncharacterized protein n=1 Tax=Leucocoprinus birnbaumii TaxID=56174 RepID=A0AAD5YZ41_9AGAR|nr:hypothetical protein NP233_g2033 [Leucocoprinus birnbaumii]
MPRSGRKKAKRQRSPEAEAPFEDTVIKLIYDVGKDPVACMLLASAMTDEKEHDFSKHVLTHHVPPDFPPRKAEKLFNAFLTWAGQATSDNPISHELEAAIHLRKSVRSALRMNKREFISKSRINRKAVVKEALLNEIPVYHVASLPPDQPYPRRQSFVAENQYIYDKNDYFIHCRRQPDT